MEQHRYRITPVNPAAHLFEVELEVSAPDPAGQQFAMPAWIPGSYMVRDYAKHVVSVRAETTDGDSVAIAKTDKSTWRCEPCTGSLRVIAEIYGYDLSVRGAHLDTTHAYFNGTCMFFLVEGQEDLPCEVDIQPPQTDVIGDWRVATSMCRKSAEEYGFGTYCADNYDDLIDHPVEIGQLSIGEFEVKGIPHAIAIRGRINADIGRICHDLEKLCSRQIEFLGAPADLDRYMFLVMALGSGYGGLEHRWSTSLACNRDDLPRRGEPGVEKNYRKFLGLCSHEYFHLWNVKRMKPAAFTPYDLRQEVHTGLLWVFEGITSYIDDLMLVRSGLITPESYLELLGQTVTRVYRTSGRFKQSVEESSFDAWTKFYKQDANSTNAIVSYYTKGSLIALTLDLMLRLKTDGEHSMDSMMRECWSLYGETGIGMPEQGFEKLVADKTGMDWTDFFDRYVRGTEDLPVPQLLKEFGVDWVLRAAEGPQDAGGKPAGNNQPTTWLGAALSSRNGVSTVTAVQSGSPAELAGIASGDEVVALADLKLSADNLEKLLRRYAPGNVVTMTVFRGDELLQLPVTLVEPRVDTCYLKLQSSPNSERLQRRAAWLS
jgi:predicted metalloprotease with PDZ domain